MFSKTNNVVIGYGILISVAFCLVGLMVSEKNYALAGFMFGGGMSALSLYHHIVGSIAQGKWGEE